MRDVAPVSACLKVAKTEASLVWEVTADIIESSGLSQGASGNAYAAVATLVGVWMHNYGLWPLFPLE